MWLIFILFTVILFGIGLIYLGVKISNLLPIKSKPIAIAFGILIAIAFAVLLSFTINFVNMLVALMHLIVILLIASLLCRLINKHINNSIVFTISIIVVAMYLSYGYYSAHTVKNTEYTINTEKVNSGLKIVMFADSHIGTTFNGKDFIKYVDRINCENADAVVICGDLLDDSTSEADLKDALISLSKLNSKYGTYYVYGNHDRGYGREKDNSIDFEKLLIESKITVLKDRSVFLNDDFAIIGREDKTRERKNVKDLILNLNTYNIVLDHQPVDYENEAIDGIDLVLSGHTHGGQMLPLQLLSDFVNDNTYGLKNIGNTDFIVTSGISDWLVDFRMGTKAEYVIININ